MIKIFAVLFLFAATTVAQAQSLKVVNSIAPIQGLVADIMRGVAEPGLLLDESTSPHDFALRPSQAKAATEADVVFYIGLDMEPWLVKLLQSGEQGKLHIALGEMPAMNHLPAREFEDFGSDHSDTHDSTIDPHMWLDPENVLLWLDIITGVLSIADPVNETIYRANLETTRLAVSEAASFTRQKMQSLKGIDLLVNHDSLQYFEVAFDLDVVGAFSASDGQLAGAKTISAVFSEVGEQVCAVTDISHPTGVLDTLPETVSQVILDPNGLAQLGGEGYYPRLLEHLADALVTCAP